MLKYCLEHTIDYISDIEYWDQNSNKGKFVTPIPSKNVRKNKCYGVHGESCNKWAKYAVTIIGKKDGFIADQRCFTGSPIKRVEERNEARLLGIFDMEVNKEIEKRYKKTDKWRRLDR